MKILLYLLISSRIVLNLSAQRDPETLVPISIPMHNNEIDKNKGIVELHTTGCFGSRITDAPTKMETFQLNMNHFSLHQEVDPIVTITADLNDISIENIHQIPPTTTEPDFAGGNFNKIFGNEGSGLQSNEKKQIVEIGSITMVVVEGIPFHGTLNTNPGYFTVAPCRTNSVVYIDGMQVRGLQQNSFKPNTDEVNNACMASDCPCNNQKATEFEDISGNGPITGLEGHNFVESPAIIYPNPVKDILNVKSTDPITVIEILNAHGEVEMILNPKEQMMLNDLPAGIYYARISFEKRKNVQVEKILVVK